MEIKVTEMRTNRAYLLSVCYIARELAAITSIWLEEEWENFTGKGRADCRYVVIEW